LWATLEEFWTMEEAASEAAMPGGNIELSAMLNNLMSGGVHTHHFRDWHELPQDDLR
jgi:hypothetical protein